MSLTLPAAPRLGTMMLLYRAPPGGFNMNITTDQLFEKLHNFNHVVLPMNASAADASVSLSAAAGGVYTAISKGGNQMVAAAQVYNAITGVNQGTTVPITTNARVPWVSTGNLWLSLTTPQGSAAVMNRYDIFGYGVD